MAWATLEQLQAVVTKYMPGTTGIQSVYTEAEFEELCQGCLDRATGQMLVMIAGKVKITDPTLCGIDMVCVDWSAGLLIQQIYRSSDEQKIFDGQTYLDRARSALASFLDNPAEQLTAMEGVDPAVDTVTAGVPYMTVGPSRGWAH
jgi:hypothetical protein